MHKDIDTIERVSKQELLLYEPMKNWFLEYLKNKNPKADVTVFDLHKVYLSDFISTHTELRNSFPDYSTYIIKIDLLGIINKNNEHSFVFVEVKDGELNFSNLGQLSVYSKLVKPSQSILISPQGINKHVNDIVNKYQRLDMLEYMPNKKIVLAKWDQHRGAIFL